MGKTENKMLQVLNSLKNKGKERQEVANDVLISRQKPIVRGKEPDEVEEEEVEEQEVAEEPEFEDEGNMEDEPEQDQEPVDTDFDKIKKAKTKERQGKE